MESSEGIRGPIQMEQNALEPVVGSAARFVVLAVFTVGEWELALEERDGLGTAQTHDQG